MQYKAFAAALTETLRKHYGGKIPAFSTIARDFALHSPAGLSPISVETPRKWLRGQSLPSLERLQTLANWLGPEILETLNGDFLKRADKHHPKKSPDMDEDIADVTEMLEQLTQEELISVKSLLHHLVDAHKTRGNGKA